MNKDYLRKIYKKRRDELFLDGSISKISNSISQKILNNNLFKQAKNIMLFYPKGAELNILEILENTLSKDKNFYLPVCCNMELDICPYKTGDEICLNKYKIYEPKSEPLCDLSILDIIITPALCADKNFNRIGYGGGYYDRLFKRKDLRAKKIIILPDEMVLKSVPYEEFDIPCDAIITEKNSYYNPRSSL